MELNAKTADLKESFLKESFVERLNPAKVIKEAWKKYLGADKRIKSPKQLLKESDVGKPIYLPNLARGDFKGLPIATKHEMHKSPNLPKEQKPSSPSPTQDQELTVIPLHNLEQSGPKNFHQHRAPQVSQPTFVYAHPTNGALAIKDTVHMTGFKPPVPPKQVQVDQLQKKPSLPFSNVDMQPQLVPSPVA